ncbi:MAG: cyclic nucleotide-binding domain-containing protein [Vulcanococcus sp.]
MAVPQSSSGAGEPRDPLDAPAWRGAREQQLAIGETLLREGEPVAALYGLVEGELSVWKRTATGTIELTRLRNGALIPELGCLDGTPAIASLTAARPCRLRVLEREACLQALERDPAFALQWLAAMSQRVRQAESRIAQLPDRRRSPSAPPAPAASTPQPAAPRQPAAPVPAAPSAVQVVLEGLTQPAQAALPSHPYVISQLPCRIGRAGTADAALNDLLLQDFEPYQVSAHHLLIFQDRRGGDGQGRIGIFDRGSERGSWLDDRRLGGLMGEESATLLDAGCAVLVLGDQDSMFRFRLVVKPV